MCNVTNRRPRTWNPRRVSDAVHNAGFTYIGVARTLGCSRPFVSQVASGKVRSWRVGSYLAGLIGRHPSELWPRLYAAPAPPSGAPTTEATELPGIDASAPPTTLAS